MKKFIEESAQFLKERGFEAPEIGIILGTGLGQFVDKVEIISSVSYNHIPNFPTATVEFHTGKLIYGTLGGKKVIVMQGRFHIYEGYTLRDVSYPVRVMNELGIKKLLISNAAGAINLNFKKGEIMLIEDHINLQGSSPLAFKGVEQLGSRFTDMSAPYDAEMRGILKDIAKTEGITLHEGVYASVVGPQLETRAEYRFLKIIGSDTVGMSTVPEVIVAIIAVGVPADITFTEHCRTQNLFLSGKVTTAVKYHRSAFGFEHLRISVAFKMRFSAIVPT